jgi:hypothetical protein
MNSAVCSSAGGGDPNGLGPADLHSRDFPYHTRFGGKPLSRDELRIGALLYPERFSRPATRGECAGLPRPCPYVGCRHHLYLDVGKAGGVKLSTTLDPSAMPASCSLDMADRGESTLEEIGELLGVTRERVRQIEARAQAKALRLIRRHPEQFADVLEVLGG